jgi:hypothetical protein
MHFQTRSLRKIWLLLIITIPFAYYCSKFLSAIPPPLSAPIPSTLSPSPYKVIEMNDRVPSFKLVTFNGLKPHVDGDRAQATVINSLELPTKCNQDPSLIVVDIGAYLGNHTLYLKKQEIVKYSFMRGTKDYCKNHLSLSCVTYNNEDQMV